MADKSRELEASIANLTKHSEGLAREKVALQKNI
jgi:hypothetical protein